MQQQNVPATDAVSQVTLSDCVADQRFFEEHSSVAKERKPKGKNVAIRPDVHDRFTEWAEKRAVPLQKQDVTSAVIDWFLKLEPVAQYAIMDQDAALDEGNAAAFERLARDLRAKLKKRQMGHDKS